jgi:hypothetical protein
VGETADEKLRRAAERGDVAAAQAALDEGANPLAQIDGKTAADLASSAKYDDVAALIERAQVVESLKAQKRYLRRFFTLVLEGRGEQEQFIFYSEGRFFSAWWEPDAQRVQEVRWWTESEFREILSYGRYGDAARCLYGAFADIPEAVVQAAPARAQRCEEVLVLLADGARQLPLEVLGPDPGSKDWFLRCHDSTWLLVMGQDLLPITADRARDEVEGMLRKNSAGDLVPVDAASASKAATAFDLARDALRRLYAGEVWSDDVKLWFANGNRLYFGKRYGGGPVATASEQTEEVVFRDLVSLYSRGGQATIAPEPNVHAEAAPLVEESGFLDLLKAGTIALGGGHHWLIYRCDGRFVRDGMSSTQEITEPQLLDILRDKRYAWVEKMRG